MIIVKIQDLPKIGGSEYARVCESNETTYLDESGYGVSFIDEADFEWSGYYSCKGWDCSSIKYILIKVGNLKCGVGDGPDNPRHLIRLEDNSELYYDTPCENYENAYRVNKPGENGYVIGCPNGLEVLHPIPTPTTSTLALEPTSSVALTSTVPTSDFNSSLLQSTTQNPSKDTLSLSSALSLQVAQPSDTTVDLDEASTQLGAGAIVGIVFASIAGITVLAVGVGIVGLFAYIYFRKGTVKSDSFSNKMIANSTV